MRILALAFLLAALLPVPAEAVTLMVNGDTPSVRYQRWAGQSEIALPAGAITLTLAPDYAHAAALCGGASACYLNIPEPRIVLSATNPAAMRATLYHEIGHWVDRRLISDATRVAFGIRVDDQRPWETGPNAPKEKFAEVFAMCAAGRARERLYRVKGWFGADGRWRRGRYKGGFDVSLSATRLGAACALITSALASS